MTKQEIVSEAIRSLMDDQGRITPEQVVEAAKAHDSPLHQFFEWDVKKAAKLHWLETASRLIRLVPYQETSRKGTIVAPFFVRDPERPANEQGYRAIQHIRTDEEAAREVLVDEMTLISGILRRTRAVAIVLGMTDTVDEIDAHVSAFLAALKQQRGDETPPPTP